MARLPVHLISATKFPVSREVIWAEIRKRGTFTIREISGDTNINTETIRTYVQGLERAGYIKRIGDDESAQFRTLIYQLTRDVGVDAPRVRRDGTEVTQGAARDQMWRTMKMIGEFTARDLAVHASTEATPVNEIDAKDYVKHLAQAGYLAIVQPSKPGTLATYRFLKSKNTGPRSPQIQRVRQVFDPNLGKVVWSEEPRP